MALLKEIRELIVRRYAEDLFDEEKKTSYGKKTYRSYGRKRARAVVINISMKRNRKLLVEGT